MAGAAAQFTFSNRAAARLAVQQDVKQVATQIAAAARDLSPRGESGEFAAGWEVVAGRDPGTWLVVNMVPHGLYVEYGTTDSPAQPSLGPAAAATGLPRW